MNLLDENIGRTKSNKKIFIACGIGIVILLFIIVALLAYVTSLNKGVSLVIDNKNYTKNGYLKKEDDVYYIQIQGLVSSIPSNGYSFKTGNPDIPDFNGCYITNSVESSYFKVDSKEYYKILKRDDGTQEIKYYTMENPVKLIESEIYMPLSAVEYAVNANLIQSENNIVIESVGYIQGMYNSKNVTLQANKSIDWNTSYSNLKMLRDRLVITKDTDNSSLIGLSVLANSLTNVGTKKKPVYKVELKNELISPRYISMEYVEKFDLLIVETESGKGILKLLRDDTNNITNVKNIITPQYENIKPINENLYIIAEKVITNQGDSTTKTEQEVIRYGIINSNQEKVSPTEYEQIGIDLPYQFTNNDLKSEYIIFDRYIPVKKDTLWGLIDLQGKEIIKPSYNAIGCADTNASSNVLIIPELNALVFKKNRTYGIASLNGTVIIKNVLNKISIDTSKEEKTYLMVYQDKTYNVINYIKNMEKNNTTNTTNKTNTTNTTNKTNTTNTTNSTQNNNSTKTTTTNTTNQTKSTNTSNSTKNSTVVVTTTTR